MAPSGLPVVSRKTHAKNVAEDDGQKDWGQKNFQSAAGVAWSDRPVRFANAIDVFPSRAASWLGIFEIARQIA